MSAMQDFVRRLFGDTPKGCCGVKFETVDSQPEAAAKPERKESGSCCRPSSDTPPVQRAPRRGNRPLS